jgi:hypothetical protein
MRGQLIERQAIEVFERFGLFRGHWASLWMQPLDNCSICLNIGFFRLAMAGVSFAASLVFGTLIDELFRFSRFQLSTSDRFGDNCGLLSACGNCRAARLPSIARLARAISRNFFIRIFGCYIHKAGGCQCAGFGIFASAGIMPSGVDCVHPLAFQVKSVGYGNSLFLGNGWDFAGSPHAGSFAGFSLLGFHLFFLESWSHAGGYLFSCFRPGFQSSQTKHFADDGCYKRLCITCWRNQCDRWMELRVSMQKAQPPILV